MLARPKQVHSQAQPLQRLQSSHHQWGLCPIPVPVPIITWWHCYIWHQIVTTSSVSLLCNSPLYCCLGSEEASRISGRDIGKYRASLDWPAESWLSIEQEDCIMRYFDTIEDKIAVYRQRVNHSVTANALSNVMQWYGWSSDDGWNCSSSSARHWTRCVMLSVDFVASRLCCNINQLLLSIITTLLPKLDDPTYQVKTQESF